MSSITVDRLSVHRRGRALVSDASVEVSPGELVVLLGPNGAGKSTLLRAALGLIEASAGCARIAGRDVTTMSPEERALRVSYLPQNRSCAWRSAVRDVVALGRFARRGRTDRLGDADRLAVRAALDHCGVLHLANRSVADLSGGELARVHLARTLASEAPSIVADEPVAALDPLQQLHVMELFRRFVDDGGDVLCVLHDINLAARFADRIVWMHHGTVVADGTVRETLSESRMAEVYGVSTRIGDDAGIRTVFIEGRCR